MTDLATLTAAEADCLADCEQRIERGLKTFVEVGTSLATIRDNRLYRAEFGTFEDYCQDRWGFDRTRAQNFITAARTVLEISNTGLPAPERESQARELARVPEPERADIWRETVERTEGKPTAAAIRDTYERTQTPAPFPGSETEAAGVDVPAASVHDHPLRDAMAEAIDQARERATRQKADRDALYAPREVVDAANAATHFVPAMVRIQSGCEDLLHRVNGIDPEQAVTDLPEQWRDRLAVARDAHAYLSRVVDALNGIGVAA